MRNLRVLALRADDGGCAFYRIKEPARVAREYGVEIEVDTHLPVEAYVDRRGHIDFKDMKTDVDVIIFQRPLLGTFTAAIDYAKKRGIATVVEIDDDFSSVHKDNVAWRGVQPEFSPYSNHQWIAKAASIADWVTVSTPALARRYGSHGRVSVLRNCVPESALSIPKDLNDPPRVGWSGSLQTHPWDLDVAGSHIGTALNRWGTEFNVVGDSYGVRQKLYIPESVPVNETGWVPVSEYYDNLAKHVDIGIVPLEQSPFNNSKSFLKGLEMAALGIPFIASPTEEYRYIAMKGIGTLASKGQEWQKSLKQLLTDRDYLLERSEYMRDAVSAYTYEANAEQWITAWLKALSHRRKNPA